MSFVSRLTLRPADQPDLEQLDPGTRMRHVRRIHMVGIGGSGMSGIAVMLKGLGYEISGSDIEDSSAIEDLRRLGIVVYIGHRPEQVEHSNVVVSSSAIDPDNAELRRARHLSIPVVPRAEMLAEIMRFRHGIAVAGTHGKTTTTSMIATVLARGGQDLSYVIGGRINNAEHNASLGGGSYMVVEADESDASFLHLQPMCTVLTNLEADHLENYQGDFDLLCKAYISFLRNLPFYGLVVLCFDDPVLRSLIPQAGRPVCSYGFDDTADYSISDFSQRGMGIAFTVNRPRHPPIQLTLNIPGRHNALNATAAVVLATEYQVDDHAISSALAEFSGVERRFQVDQFARAGGGQITMVDDYGHHPTELGVTIDVARTVYPGRRLFMVFQPHRFSRLRDLYDHFVEVLSRVDVLLVLDIYAAGEPAIVGIDSRALCRSIRNYGKVDPLPVSDLEQACARSLDLLLPDDVLVVQGAGNISGLKRMLTDGLALRGFEHQLRSATGTTPP